MVRRFLCHVLMPRLTGCFLASLSWWRLHLVLFTSCRLLMPGQSNYFALGTVFRSCASLHFCLLLACHAVSHVSSLCAAVVSR